MPDSLYDISVFTPEKYSPIPRAIPAKRSRLVQIPGNHVSLEITYDDTRDIYRVIRKIKKTVVGISMSYTMNEFREIALKGQVYNNWIKLVQQANNRREIQRGLIDFKISVPGGKESVFTTIFGKPEVNLRVTGTANMNIGASIQQIEDPALTEDQRKRIDPTFEQNLKLNIQGTIGDKLTINTDWDTERPFDYQNRLRIVYQGYDDEIIKTVELGNVSMETGNSLVSGGQALFGIKSVAQMGSLKLTSVLSQQEGEGNSKKISGGSTEEKIDINPGNYENDKHFFIGNYAYENYEMAQADPRSPIQLFNFTKLKVYKLNIGTSSILDPLQGIAIVDLGENRDILSTVLPPDDQLDAIDDDILDQIRSSSSDTINVTELANELGVDPRNIEKGFWVELKPGIDYQYDNSLSTISLNTRLQSKEALAVAFQYTLGSSVKGVGDFESVGDGVKIMKLIRQSNLINDLDTWRWTMRNIYYMGVSNVTVDGLQLDILYTGGNTPQQNLPGIKSILLQALGLDRTNINLEPIPDNRIDFGTGVLDPVSGTIRFPYLEPFGSRIANIINESGNADAQALIDKFAILDLYVDSQGKVINSNSRLNNYRIQGTSKGGVSDSYFLGFGLVEGSVKVYANGVQLSEGLDFDVDYIGGSVFITNKKYLAQGRDIEIEYESNQFSLIQQTTFTGIRAEYELSENFKVGGTFFNLKDKPITDKIRIGDEPINNSIIGFDAQGQFDLPWLTRMVDRLPLIQTKSTSSIRFKGEFAQLRPGVAQTTAVQDAVNSGNLYDDEEQGLSFIDTFEGAKTSFSFNSPIRWNLSAAPAALKGYDVDLENPATTLQSYIDRSDMRSQFSWYSVPINAQTILGIPRNRETRLIEIKDVFDRQTLQQDNFLQTMDIFYNPTQRGQYNYNMNLRNLLENEPDYTWGGMTTTLPQGLENLSLSNIEFIEFWVQPIIPDSILSTGAVPTLKQMEDYNGSFYVNLGVVSEDIIPNFSSNSEDGLVQGGENNLRLDQASRSYILNRQVDVDGQFSINSLEQEDVGLDGVPNSGGFEGKNEQVLFADFIESIRQQYGENSAFYKQVVNDPSNDDYFYYGESDLSGTTMQERFLRMFGYPEANSRTTGEKRAITNRPDAEGLIIPNVPELRNSYYEYEIKLNPAQTDEKRVFSDYVTDIVRDKGGDHGYWFQVRIPLGDFKRKIGDIQDFQSVSHIRVWMSGYKKPFTLRFASFELVGSQWRKAEEIGNYNNSSTEFLISTINVEENRNRKPIPYVIPPGAIRAKNRTQQGNLLANEQSLSLTVTDLRQGDLRMIQKVYEKPLELINYSNLRMFAHAEGFDKRGDMELIIRLGRDLENNYYEYRQPLTPSDTTFFQGLPNDINRALQREIENQVWLPELNSVNIEMSSMNALKQLRNLEGASSSALFTDSMLVENAPPGTIIGIKGEPSLQRVNVIGIGIANPANIKEDPLYRSAKSGTPSLDASVWVNELRVSGFESKKGWAANTSVGIQFADFASLNVNYAKKTDGFGSLNSSLTQRNRSNSDNISVSTSVNLHKFIPERYGWSIPTSFSYSRGLSTPRFTEDGDITLKDFADAVRATNQSKEVQDSIINAKTKEVQTFSEKYSFQLSNFSKKNSRLKWLQYTIDNSSFNYVYNTTQSRNRRTLFNDSWDYNSSYNYNLNIRKPKLWQPFGFIEEVPYLGVLSAIQLGYMPNSVSTSMSLRRNYTENQARQTGETRLPLQQTHNFNFNNSLNISYNITPTIPLTFATKSSFNLNNASEYQDPIDTTLFRIKPTFNVLNDLFTVDSIGPRRDTYQENYSASWRPQLNRIKWLNWLTYFATYQGGFSWKNSPLGLNIGSSINNRFSLKQSTSIKVQDLIGKIPFYADMKKANDTETRKREQDAKAKEREEARRKKLEEWNRENGKDTNQNQKQNQDQRVPSQDNSDVEKKKEEEKGSWFDENGVYLGRKLLLAVVSMQSLDFSYNNDVSANQNGYAGGSQLIHAFKEPGSSTFSPPFSYRLGLSNKLNEYVINPYDDRILNIKTSENFQDQLSLKTRFNPFKNINLDFSWDVAWSRVLSNNFNLEPGSNLLTNRTITENGALTTNTWVFAGGYDELFRNQLKRGIDDISNPSEGIINDETGNRDGIVITDNKGVLLDFKRAYLGYTGDGFGKGGYLPLPLPNWSLTWSGLESHIPYIKEYISRVSLSHNYQGSYRVDWAYNPDEGIENSGPFGPFTLIRVQQRIDPNSVTLQKKFVPVIGLNVTWINNVTTRVQYDYSEQITLSMTGNPTVNEKISQGVKFTTSWSKRGFRLPMFKKLQNTLDLSASASFLEDKNVRLDLNRDLVDAFRNTPYSTDPNDYEITTDRKLTETGDSRIKFSFLVGYQFSRMIKANFEYTYDHLIPKSTNIFERVNQDIRFNIIVSIRSN